MLEVKSPELYLGIETDADRELRALPEAQIADASTWAQAANPALGNMTQGTMEMIYRYGLKTYTLTVNSGQGMRRAINLGVDGIITNYPQVLRNIL